MKHNSFIKKSNFGVNTDFGVSQKFDVSIEAIETPEPSSCASFKSGPQPILERLLWNSAASE